MYELKGNIRTNFIEDLDKGHAKEVKKAAFRQGLEDEINIRFYRLWGRVVRTVENRHTTSIRFYFVDGENLYLFNAHYPS